MPPQAQAAWDEPPPALRSALHDWTAPQPGSRYHGVDHHQRTPARQPQPQSQPQPVFSPQAILSHVPPQAAAPLPVAPAVSPPAGQARRWFGSRRARVAGAAARRDPSPSRLAYRLQRLWLTPAVRRGVKAGLPTLVLAAALGLWLGDESRRLALVQTAAEWRLAFESRPEFRVSRLSVQAETPEVAQAIEQRLALDLPVSSFHLDLDALRRRVEALDAVESAALRIRSGGALEVSVVERVPAMVWRHYGGLELVDADGFRVARLVEREARADLPLIAGEGAPAAIAEAQRILAAAAPLEERLRGLVRVGERRWDLVLDRDQRILLPATGAVAALERVLALDTAQDLLARDVMAVDLRDPSRPTIRMSQPAMAELHRIRNQATGVQNR